MANRTLELVLRIRSLIDGAESVEDLRHRMDQLEDELRQAGDQAQDTDRAFGGLRAGVGGLSEALQTLAGLAVVQQFVEINKQSEALDRTLAALTGSADAAAREQQYLVEAANRLGVAVSAVSDSYIGLMTSSKGTRLEGEATREIFEAVVGSLAKMGRGGQAADQALTAISQIMGKSVVAAEELTGQLEEALPGASRALAAALGISVAELRKMVETGQVVSTDVLPALARELKKTYDIGGGAAGGLDADLARVQNAFRAVAVEIGQSGGLTVLKEGAIGAAIGVTSLHGALQISGTALGAFAAAIANLDLSGFNQAMEEANLKVRSQVAAVAQYSEKLGPAFKLTKDEAERLAAVTGKAAEQTQKAGQSAESSAGSLAKLTIAYAGLSEKLERTLTLLDRQAAAQQGWANVLKNEAELRGDVVRQTELAIKAAEQEVITKNKVMAETARQAAAAEAYVLSLKSQADTLPQVLKAAEEDAIAKQKQADAAATAAVAASQQAEATKAANTVILEALGQQGESAETARAKAQQLREEYEQMRASGASLDQLAVKMNEIVKAEDAARIAARGYREERAITLQQLDQLKGKLDGSTGAQVAYNTALERYSQQQQAASTQIERRNRLVEQAREADIAATRAAADLAEARGDEYEAARLRVVALEQELSLARDQIALRQQEKTALEAVAAAKEREADADKVRTQEELAGIQTARDAVATKQNEIATTEAAVKSKEAEIEASRRAADAKADEAKKQKEAAEALQAQAAAAADAERETRRMAAIVGYAAQNFGDLSEKGQAALKAINTDPMARAAKDAESLNRSIGQLAQGLDTAAGTEIQFNRNLQSLVEIAAGVGPEADRARRQLVAMAQQGMSGIAGITGAGEQAIDTLNGIRDAALEAKDALGNLADDYEKQILQIRGDKKTLEQLDYEDQLRKLEELRQKSGQEGQREFEEAKARAEQLHNLKLKQIADEERVKRQPASGTANANGAGSAGSSSPNAGGVTNISNNFYIDPAKLTSEEYVRRNVIPVLDKVSRLRK